MRRYAPLLPAIGILLSAELPAQSFNRDNGNCAGLTPGVVTVACWNPLAGSETPPNYARYADPLPNLQGWDYRINLPHTWFQVADLGAGGPIAMAGVVEDATPFTFDEDGDLEGDEPGHRDNAIWLFRIKQNSRFVQYKVVPSRRRGSTAENVTSLHNGWASVGPSDGPSWTPRPIAALLTGKGLGNVHIHLFMRDDAGNLLRNTHLVAGPDASWPEAWQPAGVPSPPAPVFTVAFDDRIVMAWRDAGVRVRIRVFDPATSTWGAEIATSLPTENAPQLVWDGRALNIFTQLQGRVRHSAATEADLSNLTAPALVGGDVHVRANEFHAIPFNGRLHVAYAVGSAGDDRAVMYTTSLTPPGAPSEWAPPSNTRLLTRQPPRIGSIYENLLVVAADAQGIVRYSRKDPNSAGNDLTRRSGSDHWLQAGQAVDAGQVQPLGALALLPFNSDLYLTANGTSAWIVNLSRSVFRNLMTQKWGVALKWGEIGGTNAQFLLPGRFAVGDETPAVGYFDRDRLLDFVIFHRTAEPGVGPAPVYVVRGSGGAVAARELWHSFFSLPGEIPAVGDFDGDGLSDIVTFTQQQQSYSDGTPIGPAVVWVATSDSSRFRQSRIWHRSFSARGERPLVGDFNGDGADDVASFGRRPEPNTDRLLARVALSTRTSFGPNEVWQLDLARPTQTPLAGDFDGDGKDDIVVFSHSPETSSTGQPIGAAPVWVALSDGTAFGTKALWHRDFAPRGERPAVADMNLDGRDDIVSFVSERPGSPADPRAVLVAFSDGSSFSRPVVWASDLVPAAHRPFIGNIGGNRLSDITGMNADTLRRAVGVVALRPNGSAKALAGYFSVPYPVGAPWENYRWFTEKGVGVALYPEWIYDHPGHCLAPGYIFGLLGQAGSADGGVMHTSVRGGGRAGHILEEMGHGLAANCLQQGSDPFGLWPSIYTTPVADGGLASDARPGCGESDFYSCRPDAAAEHYFLQLLSRYRLEGNRFRRFIRESPNPAVRARRLAEYRWFKEHWFHGVEFKAGPAQPGGLAINGLQCLPGECAISRRPEPPVPPVEPPLGDP